MVLFYSNLNCIGNWSCCINCCCRDIRCTFFDCCDCSCFFIYSCNCFIIALPGYSQLICNIGCWEIYNHLNCCLVSQKFLCSSNLNFFNMHRNSNLASCCLSIRCCCCDSSFSAFVCCCNSHTFSIICLVW